MFCDKVEGMNIEEIAKKAGVSIATVSHVVNKTRYVSDKLTERVLTVITESEEQTGFVLRSMKALKSSVILCLVDNLEDYFVVDILKGIRSKALENGNQVVMLNSENEGAIRKFIRMEKPCGIIIVSDKYDNQNMFNLKDIKIPSVKIIGSMEKQQGRGDVITDYYELAYKAACHVIKSGHESICFIDGNKESYTHNRMLEGYKEALRQNELEFDPSLVIRMDESFNRMTIEKLINQEQRPTALLSADLRSTKECLRLFAIHNIKCPDDISLVVFQDFEWSEFTQPELTTVGFDPEQIGMICVENLKNKINGLNENIKDTVASCRLQVRKSTQCIFKGPLGEKAEKSEVLNLSSTEIEQIRSGSYTAAVSFHYTGIAWSRLHEKGIKDVFADLGIKLLAVTDAHFDPELQMKQHASILSMNPDVLISIPSDEIIMGQSYREIVNSGTKLVLINNVPQGFDHKDYVTCVSVNERENGQSAGRILGEYMTSNKKKKVGLLKHGAPFFATKQRDSSVEQVLNDEFPEIEIVDIADFVSIKRAYGKSYEMISNHPDIEALYVSWDAPAIEVVSALRELKREDIIIVTADLDSAAALNLAQKGPIKGLSSQRPYEQGKALALAAANALIGKEVPSFIGVNPYQITADNLLNGWQELLKEEPPDEIIDALINNQK
jgi:ribose transport system substrate-binding protein